MKNTYCTSSSQYNVKNSQAGLPRNMETISKNTPSISYYDSECKMQIIITSTNEKSLHQVEEELYPILESHYINKILGKL